ncbi:MAG: gliding motility-associated C-terminal domain-containing protein [Sphingobacteriales bacterium]|nr:gliding motility-associated C-terminal domain-containing protein [Sphingobacteriales bacterium]
MKFSFNILTLLLLLLLANRNLKAGSCIPNGTMVTLTRQSEVDSFPINYPGCDVVDGILAISGYNITNLDSLKILKRISGLHIEICPNLLNLKGLDSLKKVDNLYIYANESLLSMQGLSNLDTIGNFDVTDNNSLLNFQGLVSIKYCNSLNIQLNDSLIDFSGLNNLKEIQNVYISGNDRILNFQGLNNLRYIYSLSIYNNRLLINLEGLNNLFNLNYFTISGNDALLNLNGLENITMLYQHCTIRDNNSLQDFTGLNNVIRFNGALDISRCPSIINFSGLGNVSFIGGFYVFANSNLRNFFGLNKLDTVENNLNIAFNPNLKDFEGLQKLSNLKNAGITISNNNSLCTVNQLNKNLLLSSHYSVDISNNPNLSCCKILDTILNNNQLTTSVYVHNNATGCNDTTEIRTITTQNCCSTKYTFLKDTICQGESVVFDGKTLSSSGTYYDTIILGSIDSIIVFQLIVRSKTYQIQPKNLCIGQSITLSNGRVITTDGIYKDTIPNFCDSIIEYRLSFLNNITINQNPTICKGKTYILPKGNTVSVSGIYRDTIRNGNGCDSIITTNLTITNPIPFTKLVSICEGQSYILPNGNKVNTSGIYNDTLRKPNTCDSIVITNLNVFPNNFTISLNAMDTIESGSTITLLPIYTSGTAVNWNWTPATNLSCSTCESPVASPIQTTLYVVNVKASDGCEDTAQTKIFVRQTNIYVPQAFSPNNDGVNDFAVVFASNPKSFSMKIYNRWGELVFENNDVNNPWNGTYKGADCPQDNYTYILDVTMQNGKSYHKQSSILLLR